MENLGVIPFEKVDDVSALDQYHVATEAGYSEEEALKIISLYNRDNARTPVQWNAGHKCRIYNRHPMADGKPELYPD